MSIDLFINGYLPPDDVYNKKAAAYQACVDAGVEVPGELKEYFNWEEPTEYGTLVGHSDLIKCGALEEFRNDYQDGYIIHFDALPIGVEKLKVGLSC